MGSRAYEATWSLEAHSAGNCFSLLLSRCPSLDARTSGNTEPFVREGQVGAGEVNAGARASPECVAVLIALGEFRFCLLGLPEADRSAQVCCSGVVRGIIKHCCLIHWLKSPLPSSALPSRLRSRRGRQRTCKVVFRRLRPCQTAVTIMLTAPTSAACFAIMQSRKRGRRLMLHGILTKADWW